MTQTDSYREGFLSGCRAHGIEGPRADSLFKIASEGLFENTRKSVGPFLKDLGKDARKAYDVTSRAVKDDYVNNGLVPGFMGLAGGALLGNLTHSYDDSRTPGENARRKKRRMLTMAVLAALGLTAANAHGIGRKYIPKLDVENQ